MRLLVLLRAAKGPVSEQSIVAEFERRKIVGVTLARTHRLLRDLVERSYFREIDGAERTYAATRLGKQAALEVRGRLSELLRATRDE